MIAYKILRVKLITRWKSRRKLFTPLLQNLLGTKVEIVIVVGMIHEIVIANCTFRSILVF